jgi:lysozyme
VIDNVRSLLELHEGLRLTSYKDTLGFWTIGYGHLLGKSDQWQGIHWTLTEAEQRLDADIAKARADVTHHIPWATTLSEVRQAVLIDMAFNLGIEGLLKFKNTLALIEAGKFDDASGNMLKSLWAREVPVRASQLSRMMASNTWPGGK